MDPLNATAVIIEDYPDPTVVDPDYFSDTDYGLLNAALFVQQNPGYASGVVQGGGGGGDNLSTVAEVSTAYRSGYSQFAVVVLSLIITAMMVVILVGNILVVIAIFTERNLTGVQNWFIASLAFADLCIGSVVMPFSLAYTLLGYWMFGNMWCSIHSAMDVMTCTASIMNICLISLDRYWSITKAIEYLTNRTPARVMIMIFTVWALSGLISIPPLLGWKVDQDLTWFHDLLAEKGNMTHVEFLEHIRSSGEISLQNFTDTLTEVVYPQCMLSEDLGYVMYSAFGSFYIPSAIMVFVYIKIYFAARERARRNIKKKKARRRSMNNRNNLLAPPPTPSVSYAPSGSVSGTPATSRAVSPAVVSKNPTGERQQVEVHGHNSDEKNGKAALKAKSTAVVLGNGSVSNGTNGTKTTTTTTPEPRSAMKRAKSDGENSAESNKFEKKTRFTFEIESSRKQQPASAKHDSERISATVIERVPGCPHGDPRRGRAVISAPVAVALSESPLNNGDNETDNCDYDDDDEEDEDDFDEDDDLCTPPSRGGEGSSPCPSSAGLPSPAPAACNGANHRRAAQLTRERRSIGVSTRPDSDENSTDSNSSEQRLRRSENGAKSARTSSSSSSTPPTISTTKPTATNRLMTRFRVPLSGRLRNQRGPGKEDREVMDTGRIKRWREKREQKDKERRERREAKAAAAAAVADEDDEVLQLRSLPAHSRRPLRRFFFPSSSSAAAAAAADGGATKKSDASQLQSPSKVNGFKCGRSSQGSKSSPGAAAAAAAAPSTPEESERERKRVARKKERRATLILGLIMGSFIACWFPFFFLYSIREVEGPGFSFAFWLGYSNSALNPVIYTVFNKDFRRAFKRILFK